MKHIEFEWEGNHPALNFVNTLDERPSAQPLERLNDFAALVNFSRQAGLINDVLAERLVHHEDEKVVWAAAVELRERLHNVLRARIDGQSPPHADVVYLEQVIQGAKAAQQLAVTESGFQWVWREPNSLERLLGELALTIENLLLSDKFDRVKKCAAPDCGVLYLDDSRAGSRRWCSMASCGNRHKVQQFRSSRKNSAS